MIQRNYYLDRLIRNMWNGEIKVITGIRRCGKSVLLFELFDEYLRNHGTDATQIIKIELDQRRYYKYRNPITLCEYVEQLVLGQQDKKLYLFIDEVQLTAKVIDQENGGIEVTIYDMLNELKAYKNLDVYVTGSNSKGLSKDIATEFRGRTTQIHKIFSHATYKNYWKHIKYFLGYIKEKHPECTTLKNAKKYVNEWLRTRVDQGLSAWTVQLEAKALGKLYGISPDDEAYFDPPKRNRQDIKRSRGDRVRDQHFSKTNNDELIKFCRGTGLRRRELQELRGKDLVSREQIEAELAELEEIPKAQQAPSVARRLEILRDTQLFPEARFYTHVRNGKGGRERLSPIIGKHADQIVERIADTAAEEKVWQHIHTSADIHGYRAGDGAGHEGG